MTILKQSYSPITYGRAKQRRKGALSVKAVLSFFFVTLFGLQLFLVFLPHEPPPDPLTASPANIVLSSVNLPPISSSDLSALPKWISEYIAWHNEMRAKFPGKQLFEHADAPNVILRVCLGICGGLNDRLGQLPWDLYLANQTRRVLLIKWERPKALENFLVPNAFDWTVPSDVAGFANISETRAHTNLFEGFREDRPEQKFWDSELDISLERATKGEFKDIKVLRHILLGHLNEDVLERRLRDLGETDMLHWTPSFGHIFHAFFRPSQPVQAEMDLVYHSLGLQSGMYTAVHCRVRHPKATPYGLVVKGKNPSYPADKTGLPWFGVTKDFAVSIATHAVLCARTLAATPNEPIYFFSDSNDLVRYMAHELPNPQYLIANQTLVENPVDQAALKAVKPAKVVAREMSLENAHIDRQKGRPANAYYATFVDLMLAVNARCVTYGIGFYAIFASKISGIQCKLVYQKEEWGSKAGAKGADLCTSDTYKDLTD